MRSISAGYFTNGTHHSQIFAFREKDWAVSLSLVGGREHIKLLVSDYQIGKIKGQKPNSATLIKHPSGEVFINIQVNSQVSVAVNSRQ